MLEQNLHHTCLVSCLKTVAEGGRKRDIQDMFGEALSPDCLGVLCCFSFLTFSLSSIILITFYFIIFLFFPAYKIVDTVVGCRMKGVILISTEC